MPYPHVFCHFLNGMSAPQKMSSLKALLTFFSCIHYVKINEMVYEYFSNKNLLKIHICFSKGIKYRIFSDHQSSPLRRLNVLLNYPYTNIKKLLYQKKVCMRHCPGADWEGEIKYFLKGGIKKEGDCLKRGKYPLRTRYALPHITKQFRITVYF